MATNMPPHNLVEVIGAARHLIAHPDAHAGRPDAVRPRPGPADRRAGSSGLDGIREAYATGRGTFRTRATTRIETVTARRKGIVVTELPYTVGPEKVIEKIKDLVQAKKLQGIADVKDLTDRSHGLRLVIEVKNGFNPEAILEQLYRLTPMEDSFGINNVALVDGPAAHARPARAAAGLRRLPDRRRAPPHRASACASGEERLHLVEGLLIAIVDIDEVIQVIRSSDDAAAAKARLMDVFDLSDAPGDVHPRPAAAPADQVLARRAGDRAGRAARQIEELRAILGDEELLLRDGVRPSWPRSPRRTAPLAARCCWSPPARRVTAATPLEVADDPCWVLLSSTGLLARTTTDDPLPADGDRHTHDVVISAVPHDGPRRRSGWSPPAGG